MPLPDVANAIKRHQTAAEFTALLLFILPLACFLRCDRLALPSLNRDEAVSWRLTTYSIPELLCHLPGDAHPPLYYLVLKTWTVIFGDSPSALRSLSVFFALASILVLYVLCRESAARFPSTPHTSTMSISGAFFSVFLLTTHLDPAYEPSRIARMYSQGIFLAGLTSWLLLRALRCSRGCLGWWLGYSLAVTAFCYTHYYASFTIAAQTLFVAGDLVVRVLRNSAASVRASLTGFLLAGCFAFLLYSPWLPVWWKQTHDVWQKFWIAPVTLEHAREVFFRWSSGAPNYHPMEFRCWTLFLLVCIAWIVCRADRGGFFLLMQASVPWALSLVFSAWSGRPIFDERYLLFAQFFLFAFWGVVWDRLPGLVPRLGLGCFLCVLSLSNLEMIRQQWPTRPPALSVAAAFLRVHYQEGDIILTSSPGALNCLLYYTAQAGVPSIPIRCIVDPFQPPGHVLHLGSLQAEDVLWPDLSFQSSGVRRVWKLRDETEGVTLPGEHWREVSQWSFGGGKEDYYYLILY